MCCPADRYYDRRTKRGIGGAVGTETKMMLLMLLMMLLSKVDSVGLKTDEK